MLTWNKRTMGILWPWKVFWVAVIVQEMARSEEINYQHIKKSKPSGHDVGRAVTPTPQAAQSPLCIVQYCTVSP